jgi:thiamine pyrophosphate-dependent acetolactate synthase large subunit-like protein
MEPVVALVEQLKAPVMTTFKGKGLISDSHPLAGGVLGRSGTPIATWLMHEADRLLVFAASFSNYTGITPWKPTIQVDFDLMTLAKFHAIDVPVSGCVQPMPTPARLRPFCARAERILRTAHW